MICDVCGANVIELRRGRCWGCYNRWVENRPVGVGARCCICGERRRDFLRTTELLGGWWPTCYSCSGRVHALEMIPHSLGEIRDALDRERRGKAPDRRAEKPDSRVFQYNRRRIERRAVGDGRMAWPSLYDEVSDLAGLGDAMAGEDTVTAAVMPGEPVIAEGTDPGSESPFGVPGELDDLALQELAMEIAQAGEYDPDLTCIHDLGWAALEDGHGPGDLPAGSAADQPAGLLDLGDF